ncbi:VCBS repeat-containing protein [Patescibacteria group bacterium]|nr:VCBS repeat-containing protein [Patescibacteria group bacterium]
MDILVSWGSYATHTLIGYKGIGGWNWERKLEWDTLVPWCRFGVIPALGDLNKDGFPDIICLGLLSEENNGSITFFAFENNKGDGFINRQEWASKETNGQGSALRYFPGSIELVDLDGDSDLDIYYITGGFNCPDGMAYQENIGSTSPVWKKKKEFRISIIPHKIVNFDFKLCNIDFVDINGDGYEDLYVGSAGIICGCENTKKIGQDSEGTYYIFSVKEPWLFQCQHSESGLALVDLDNDRDYEEICGEGFSCWGCFLHITENTGTPETPDYGKSSLLEIILLSQEDPEKRLILASPAIADLDNDGKVDLLVGSFGEGGWQVYRNISTLTLAFESKKEWEIRGQDMVDRFNLPFYGCQLSTRLTLADLDADGDYDLIVGCQEILFCLENIGTPEAPDFVRKTSWELPEFNYKHNAFFKPTLCDLDEDGDYDLIVGSSEIYVYENIGSIYSPKWQRNPAWTENFNYHINSFAVISPVDLDNDGDYDFGTIFSCEGPFLLRNIGDHFLQGSFTSSIIKIETELPLIRIWQDRSVPADCSLNLYVRTGNTSIPDASWSLWREVPQGGEIPSSFIYIQYQAVLMTLNPDTSPILYGIRIVDATSPLSFQISPSSGNVGDLVILKGEGFSPNSLINLCFGASTMTTQASLKGSFSISFFVSPQPESIISVLARDTEGNLLSQSFILLSKRIYVDVSNTQAERGSKDYPFRTIQGAIDLAIDGYFIEVASGTYREHLVIDKKKVYLIGVGLPAISSEGNGPSVKFFFSSSGSSISGFRITADSGYYNNRGIECSGDIFIYNNVIASNSVEAILCNSSSPVIANNIITGNSNGIKCLQKGSPKIINNTIIRNKYHGIYYNIYGMIEGESYPLSVIFNNIIAENGTGGNTYYAVYNETYSRGTPTIENNCIFKNGKVGTNTFFNCSPAFSNIFSDPLFVGNTDYHLGTTSPCINAGTTSAFLPDKDMDKNPRIVNKKVDIGAYEYQGNACPPNIILRKSSDKGFVAKGGTITYTIRYENIGEKTAEDVTIIEVLPEHCVLKGVGGQGSGVRYWYNGDWQSTFTESATKIKWVIPVVSPAEAGTVSFTVEIR